jgi:hypothetical protein
VTVIPSYLYDHITKKWAALLVSALF